MNIVLIVIDTLRKDHVGCYGNDWIRTPHLDRLAHESVLFTNAYPESLPTLPFRRALHTGRRVFPFRGHRLFKGDIVGAAGWGPVSEEHDTIAEVLHRRGWRTAFVTDVYHQFKPSKNFHRGFDEWRWIRGQETDPYRSGPDVPMEIIMQYVPESLHSRDAGDRYQASLVQRGGGKRTPVTEFLRKYLRNVAERETEEDYFPAQVFREAADWIARNRDAERFFLVIDSFDPHEPWDPPTEYRRMYDPEDDVREAILSLYGPASLYSERELTRLRANYAGEVTLVDRWLGHFLDALQREGLWQDTIIAVISDHGHCIGEHGLVSKHGHPLTPEIADLVLMIRHPSGEGAGTQCDEFVYNHDLIPTLLKMIDEQPAQPMEGMDIWDLAIQSGTQGRDHVTCAWGPFVTVTDGDYWYNAFLWGETPLLYDLKTDPLLSNNIAAQNPDICGRLGSLGIADAGGEIPQLLRQMSGLPGCTPLVAEDW